MDYTLTTEDFEKARAWMRRQAPAFADKLAPVYETLKWRLKDEIPNRDYILSLILGLVDGLKMDEGSNGCWASSGGIEVGVVRDGPTSFEGQLFFTLKECLFESCSNPYEGGYEE